LICLSGIFVLKFAAWWISVGSLIVDVWDPRFAIAGIKETLIGQVRVDEVAD
jgi:hypothetical protein